MSKPQPSAFRKGEGTARRLGAVEIHQGARVLDDHDYEDDDEDELNGSWRAPTLISARIWTMNQVNKRTPHPCPLPFGREEGTAGRPGQEVYRRGKLTRGHGAGTRARNSRGRLSNPLTIVLARRKIRRPTGGGPKQAV